MKFDATYIVLILLALVARVVPLVLAGGLLLLVVRRLKRRDTQSEGGNGPPPPSGVGGVSALDGLTLSQRLRELRTAAGYSQELLAERLGVSRQAVSKWETGTAEPSTANLLALAELYGITVDALLRGRPNP